MATIQSTTFRIWIAAIFIDAAISAAYIFGVEFKSIWAMLLIVLIGGIFSLPVYMAVWWLISKCFEWGISGRRTLLIVLAGGLACTALDFLVFEWTFPVFDDGSIMMIALGAAAAAILLQSHKLLHISQLEAD